ncbi:MAG: lamin tail domain-containing protein [Fibromonadaceae bacterium]|nr:lamin tail domain-containing protein [Fibromonadaceae bacterium]
MLMLRHFCILCIAACSFWSAMIGLLLVACSGGGSGGGGSGSDTEGTVKLFLGKVQVPMFDSISVDVSSADMASIHVSKKTLDENLKIEGIPPGETRKFEVKIYADSGVLVQKGEAIADIKAGESITIPINLKALVGFLRLEVPLGFNNNTGVSSGKLYLDDLEFDMKIENGKGVFTTGSLPLDKDFNMRIELKDDNGEILFTGSKNVSLSSISQTETMQSQSTRGSVILELSASSAGSSQGVVTLPTNSRPPKNYGDVFFTEIFADPKTSGNEFEYLEIYNATLDTLKLSSCRIARDRNTTANTYKFDMPDNLILPPMEFLFFGRDSVKNANFNYKGLTLANTGQSLGIFCDKAVIDSIYFSKAENFPLKTGTAMQLPLENYEKRALGSSWCLGFSPGEDAVCQ